MVQKKNGNAVEGFEQTHREVYELALFAMENPDPLFRINLQGKAIWENKAASHVSFFCVDNQLLKKDDFFSFLTQNLSQTKPALKNEAIGNNTIYQVSSRLSEKGEYIHLYCSDITEKKEAEQNLINSEKRMAAMVQSLRSAILLEDENRHILLCNDMFCKLFSIPATPEQLVGVDCSSSAEESSQLFRNPAQFSADIRALLAARKPVLGEKLELKDGRTFERDYIPVFVGDEYRGHLWKYSDITERSNFERKLTEQEEKYRSIIENMNLGLLEVDLDDRIMYANHTFCDFSGYSLEELLNRKGSDLFIDPANRQVIAEKNELRKRNVSDSYELKVTNKNGEDRWWLITGAPNYNDKGQLVGSIGIHLDITQQKKLEEELRVSRKKAEESARAKEAFLANMSHEIRTPLNAIIGMVREVSKTPLSDKQKIYLDHTSSASQHLLSIVNNILDISKIEAGEFRLEERSFSLAGVIRETEGIMSPLAKEKMLELIVETDSTLEPTFIGDPGRIRQVLLNLLSNAIKFTETGTINVKCSALRKENGRQRVFLSVSDTGVGMESSYLKNLFRKFSQEDASIARRYGGTGLGMAITHELVQLMGGSIHVDSVKGRGTTFVVELSMTPGESTHENESGGESPREKLRGRSVLLVEDSELNRMVASQVLRRYDLNITEATNGIEAIQLLKEKSFDVILMDLQMPKMGGLEATAILRKELKIVTPVIALTANTVKKEIENCLSSGMNGHVSKPFDEKVLIDTIATLIPENSASAAAVSEAIPLYDLSTLVETAAGDTAFIEKMIELFCQQASGTANILRQSLQSGDYQAIRKAAHKIKPGLDTLGIPLTKEIRALESIGDEATTEDISLLVSVVAETLTRVAEKLSTDTRWK